jgi:hypothetical protein
MLDEDQIEIMKDQIKNEKPEVDDEKERIASLESGVFEQEPPPAPKKSKSEKNK